MNMDTQHWLQVFKGLTLISLYGLYFSKYTIQSLSPLSLLLVHVSPCSQNLLDWLLAYCLFMQKTIHSFPGNRCLASLTCMTLCHVCHLYYAWSSSMPGPLPCLALFHAWPSSMSVTYPCLSPLPLCMASHQFLAIFHVCHLFHHAWPSLTPGPLPCLALFHTSPSSMPDPLPSLALFHSSSTTWHHLPWQTALSCLDALSCLGQLPCLALFHALSPFHTLSPFHACSLPCLASFHKWRFCNAYGALFNAWGSSMSSSDFNA